MTFGERLTELRTSAGYTKRNEFADKLGIPSTTLRNYETDVREPGHTFLKQISEFFNVTTDYVLCLSDNKRDSTRQLQAMNEFEQFHDFLQRYQRLNPLMQDAMLNMLEQLENIQENTILTNSSISPH